MHIRVTESTRKRGGQTNRSTSKGDKHLHFLRLELFYASFLTQDVILILKSSHPSGLNVI